MKEIPEKRAYFNEYAALCRKYSMCIINAYESGEEVIDYYPVESHLAEVERFLDL